MAGGAALHQALQGHTQQGSPPGLLLLPHQVAQGGSHTLLPPKKGRACSTEQEAYLFFFTGPS